MTNMGYDLITNIESCHTEVPTLLYYSHIPPAIIALLLGIFILIKSKENRMAGRVFFLITLTFSLWVLIEGTIWLLYNSVYMMLLWSLLGLLYSLLNILSVYFVYVSFEKRNVSELTISIFALLLLPILILTPTSYNITGFDIPNCQALEGHYFILYRYFIGVISILWVCVLTYQKFRRSIQDERRQVLVLGLGVMIFLFLFSWSEVAGSLTEDFNVTQYGLFGMPIFLGLFSYSIVKFHTFNTRLIGANALVVTLWALVFSLLFINDLGTIHIITSVTFALLIGVGLSLMKSVRLEVQQREEIEALAKTLDETNGRQETLIHFIGHEVKGFLTKDSGTFAALLDGDFGTIPDTAKPLVEQALASSRNGADSVAAILKASNLKKGTVAYEKKAFDMKDLAAAAVERAKSMATQKSLNLSLNVGEGDYKTVGDGPQINDHVLRNLIENAINYTPGGKVEVSLSRKANRIVFAVKDSGVGITEADKKRLFTEGGHGENSQKVNAHSTGYGLFIAKQITEAHGGTIRADSEGEGKGSTFTAEFPVVKEAPVAATAPKA